MRADSIRRFLQPAAEVRYPYAVPTFLAVAGILALFFIITLGGREVQWAIPILLWIAAITSFFAALASADIRIERTFPKLRTAFFSLVSLASLFFAIVVLCFPVADGALIRSASYEGGYRGAYQSTLLSRGAIGTLTWRSAQDIDGAIAQWAKDERESLSSTVKGWLYSRKWIRWFVMADASAMRNLAEQRLSTLSGAAPAWAVTSKLCAEGNAHQPSGYRFTWDYNLWAERASKDYTLLLGREIKPADLLPLVPNGRCE